MDSKKTTAPTGPRGRWDRSGQGAGTPGAAVLEAMDQRATEQLYRDNAFRITGQAVGTSLRDVKRQKARMAMRGQLGMAGDDRPCLPLKPAPDPQTLSAATHRLQDPVQRLVDELFWFWPETPNDPVIELLKANRAGQAIAAWQQNPGRFTDHNLAVLYHTMALDVEIHCDRDWDPDLHKQARTYWSLALDAWSRSLSGPASWDHLGQRMDQLDDPRLTEACLPQIREAMARVLLAPCAQLIRRRVERDQLDRAMGLIQLVRNNPLDASLADDLLAQAAAPLCQRIEKMCQDCHQSADADPAGAGQAARNLLDKAQPILKAIDAMLPAGSIQRDGLHDDLAKNIRYATVEYHNHRKGPNQEILDLMGQARRIAASQPLQESLDKEIQQLEEARGQARCFFCEQDDGEPESNVHIRVDHPRMHLLVQRGLDPEKLRFDIPRCGACRNQHRRELQEPVPLTPRETLLKIIQLATIAGVVALISGTLLSSNPEVHRSDGGVSFGLLTGYVLAYRSFGTKGLVRMILWPYGLVLLCKLIVKAFDKSQNPPRAFDDTPAVKHKCKSFYDYTQHPLAREWQRRGFSTFSE